MLTPAPALVQNTTKRVMVRFCAFALSSLVLISGTVRSRLAL